MKLGFILISLFIEISLEIHSIKCWKKQSVKISLLQKTNYMNIIDNHGPDSQTIDGRPYITLNF